MVSHLLVRSSERPVLLVLFEDLKQKLALEMRRILSFLNYDVDDSVLNERLKYKFNHFYRNHTDSFEHYTKDQIHYINSVISSLDPWVVPMLPLRQYIRVYHDMS